MTSYFIETSIGCINKYFTTQFTEQTARIIDILTIHRKRLLHVKTNHNT